MSAPTRSSVATAFHKIYFSTIPFLKLPSNTSKPPRLSPDHQNQMRTRGFNREIPKRAVSPVKCFLFLFWNFPWAMLSLLCWPHDSPLFVLNITILLLVIVVSSLNCSIKRTTKILSKKHKSLRDKSCHKLAMYLEERKPLECSTCASVWLSFGNSQTDDFGNAVFRSSRTAVACASGLLNIVGLCLFRTPVSFTLTKFYYSATRHHVSICRQ